MDICTDWVTLHMFVNLCKFFFSICNIFYSIFYNIELDFLQLFDLVQLMYMVLGFFVIYLCYRNIDRDEMVFSINSPSPPINHSIV